MSSKKEGCKFCTGCGVKRIWSPVTSWVIQCCDCEAGEKLDKSLTDFEEGARQFQKERLKALAERLFEDIQGGPKEGSGSRDDASQFEETS